MRSSRVRVMVLGGLLFCGALMSSCSCDDAKTSGQEAVFAWDLEEDPTGEADYLVDFGVVALGDRALEVIEVRNTGNSALVVQAEDLAAPFSDDVPQRGLRVGVGGSGWISFGFEPEEETEGPTERILTVDTNERGEGSYTVRLVGHGKKASVLCSPARIDFGAVRQGSSKTLSSSCTNPLPIAVEIEGPRLLGADGVYFDASVGDIGDGPISVPAGGAVEVSIRFDALTTGSKQASLDLIDPFSQVLASIALEAVAVESALVIEPASCLEFAYVGVGETALASFALRAVGGRELQVDRVEIPALGQEAFSVAERGPLLLEADGSPRGLEVAFHPKAGGPHSTEVLLHLDEGLPTYQVRTACAKGFGGGPALQCTPSLIDFGQVAVGMVGRRIVDCINAGVGAPGAVIDPLYIRGLRSSEASFQVELVNPDGEEGPKATGYQLGEGFQLEIAYEPSGESFDSGLIQLETNLVDEEIHEVQVAGQGRELPACEFSLEPPAISFGIVERGQELSLPFAIRNELETPCLIYDLHLVEGSHEAFSLTPLQSLELGGHEVYEAEVSFAPGAYQELFTGAIAFQISSEEQVNQQIPLEGGSRSPCLLIEPPLLDFGKVGKGCSSDERWVSVSNVCSSPVEVVGLEIGEAVGSDAFVLQGHPTLPRTLHPREKLEVQIAYRPAALGDHRSSLLVDVSDSLPYVSRLMGRSSLDLVQTDVFDQEAMPKVDILWVIDNSTSFGPYQRRIAENLSAFLSAANEQEVDFHLAVTSNGIRPANHQCRGGAQGGEDGRFFPIDGSFPRILTPQTPFLVDAWMHNAQLGVCHVDEFHIEAAYRALSEPLINEAKSSKHFSETSFQDGNAGFLRRDASLSIIFASDDTDRSGEMELHEYLAFFQGLKGKNMFRAHAITGSKASQPSSCGLRNADRLHYLVEETGGTWMDICTPTNDHQAWTAGMREMSLGAFGFLARFELRGQPDDRNGDGEISEADIVLEVDGIPMPASEPGGPQRWSYDEEGRTIHFTRNFIPQTGSQITATYSVACTP